MKELQEVRKMSKLQTNVDKLAQYDCFKVVCMLWARVY